MPSNTYQPTDRERRILDEYAELAEVEDLRTDLRQLLELRERPDSLDEPEVIEGLHMRLRNIVLPDGDKLRKLRKVGYLIGDLRERITKLAMEDMGSTSGKALGSIQRWRMDEFTALYLNDGYLVENWPSDGSDDGKSMAYTYLRLAIEGSNFAEAWPFIRGFLEDGNDSVATSKLHAICRHIIRQCAEEVDSTISYLIREAKDRNPKSIFRGRLIGTFPELGDKINKK